MKKNTLTTVLIVVAALAVLAAGGLYLLKSGTPENASAQADKAVLEGGVQLVESELTASGYPDLMVQEGVPVRWNLYAAPGSLNSCNNAIVIPEYGIEVALQEGDNLIEFTPGESGTIPYSCWMGMINADIRVVPDLAAAGDVESTQTLAGNQNQGAAGGGCCGVPGN